MQDKRANTLHKQIGTQGAGLNRVKKTASNAEPKPVRASQNSNQQDVSTQATSANSLQVTLSESEIRRDYIYDEYAIIAPKRHDRPFDFRGNDHPLIETASSPHLNDQTVIDELKSPLGGWPVRVVENKFPAITLQTPKAYGQQEIVVDTPLSNTPPGKLSPESMFDLLAMIQKRIRALYKLNHIQYVQVFKNDGHRAGASLAHAHTQIFALPLVPPRYSIRAQKVKDYVSHKGTNPFDDIISYEQRQKNRIISDTKHTLSFTPYASCWSLEAWILPKRHIVRFSDLKPEELKDCANSLLNILRNLNRHDINYNFFIEDGATKDQRAVIKVYGRDVVSPLGGLEVSTGIMINTIPPEDAARWYKQKP